MHLDKSILLPLMYSYPFSVFLVVVFSANENIIIIQYNNTRIHQQTSSTFFGKLRLPSTAVKPRSVVDGICGMDWIQNPEPVTKTVFPGWF